MNDSGCAEILHSDDNGKLYIRFTNKEDTSNKPQATSA